MGELCPTELSWPLQMRIKLPRHDLLGEKRLANVSEKSPEHLFPWAFIEFSLHRDTYQRKDIWFTGNISGIMKVLLSHGLVDRLMPIGHKTWRNKLIFCLDPKHLVYIDLQAFLTKQVSRDLMLSFSGLIAPGNKMPVPAQGCTCLLYTSPSPRDLH